MSDITLRRTVDETKRRISSEVVSKETTAAGTARLWCSTDDDGTMEYRVSIDQDGQVRPVHASDNEERARGVYRSAVRKLRQESIPEPTKGRMMHAAADVLRKHGWSINSDLLVGMDTDSFDNMGDETLLLYANALDKLLELTEQGHEQADPEEVEHEVEAARKELERRGVQSSWTVAEWEPSEEEAEEQLPVAEEPELKEALPADPDKAHTAAAGVPWEEFEERSEFEDHNGYQAIVEREDFDPEEPWNWYVWEEGMDGQLVDSGQVATAEEGKRAVEGIVAQASKEEGSAKTSEELITDYSVVDIPEDDVASELSDEELMDELREAWLAIREEPQGTFTEDSGIVRWYNELWDEAEVRGLRGKRQLTGASDTLDDLIGAVKGEFASHDEAINYLDERGAQEFYAFFGRDSESMVGAQWVIGQAFNARFEDSSGEDVTDVFDRQSLRATARRLFLGQEYADQQDVNDERGDVAGSPVDEVWISQVGIPGGTDYRLIYVGPDREEAHRTLVRELEAARAEFDSSIEDESGKEFEDALEKARGADSGEFDVEIADTIWSIEKLEAPAGDATAMRKAVAKHVSGDLEQNPIDRVLQAQGQAAWSLGVEHGRTGENLEPEELAEIFGIAPPAQRLYAEYEKGKGIGAEKRADKDEDPYHHPGPDRVEWAGWSELEGPAPEPDGPLFSQPPAGPERTRTVDEKGHIRHPRAAERNAQDWNWPQDQQQQGDPEQPPPAPDLDLPDGEPQEPTEDQAEGQDWNWPQRQQASRCASKVQDTTVHNVLLRKRGACEYCGMQLRASKCGDWEVRVDDELVMSGKTDDGIGARKAAIEAAGSLAPKVSRSWRLVEGETYLVNGDGAYLERLKPAGSWAFEPEKQSLNSGERVEFVGYKKGFGDSPDMANFRHIDSGFVGEFNPNSWGTPDKSYLVPERLYDLADRIDEATGGGEHEINLGEDRALEQAIQEFAQEFGMDVHDVYDWIAGLSWGR